MVYATLGISIPYWAKLAGLAAISATGGTIIGAILMALYFNHKQKGAMGQYAADYQMV